MKTEFARQVLGDGAVARPRHAQVGFGEQQHITRFQIIVIAECFELPVKLDAALQVPGEEAVAIAGGRGLGSEVASLRALKDRAHRRFQRTVDGAGYELRGGAAPGKLRKTGGNLFFDEPVDVLRSEERPTRFDRVGRLAAGCRYVSRQSHCMLYV